MKPHPYGQGHKIRYKLHVGYKLIRGLYIFSGLYWFLASDCDLRSQIKGLPGRRYMIMRNKMEALEETIGM